MIAIAVPALAGCSGGTAGLVSGEILDADGAQVIVVSGYGPSFRSTPVDRGLKLGFTRRAYIYPDNTPGLPAAGNYNWWIPQPEIAPVAWNTSAVGLDLTASRLGVGVSLGYQADTVMAYLPANADTFYALRFKSSDPAQTIMQFCNGELSCAELVD